MIVMFGANIYCFKKAVKVRDEAQELLDHIEESNKKQSTTFCNKPTIAHTARVLSKVAV